MFVLVVGACAPDPVTPVDASIDAAANADAPYMCRPRGVPGPACLALAPAALRGTTPFGTLDVAVDYFGAGDCITISRATIALRGACGEQLMISFPYPVHTAGSGRVVTESFDAEAWVMFTPPGGADGMDAAQFHVAVTRWQEGAATGTHDIDIELSTADPRYAFEPLHVAGTFCDWPYYVC